MVAGRPYAREGGIEAGSCQSRCVAESVEQVALLRQAGRDAPPRPFFNVKYEESRDLKPWLVRLSSVNVVRRSNWTIDFAFQDIV